MKTKQFFFQSFIAAMTLLLSTGCNKDDEDDIVLPEIDPQVAAISHKWVSKDAASDYASFEFQTDGTVIVTKYVDVQSSSAYVPVQAKTLRVKSVQDLKLPETPFCKVVKTDAANTQAAKPSTRATRTLTTYVGQYKIESNVITLIDYGLITDFIVNNNNEFEFTFKPDGSIESIEFVGSQAPAIEASKRTTLMCRMWQVEKTTFKSDGILGDLLGSVFESLLYSLSHQEIDGKKLTLCVMMSTAGTYLSIWRDEAGEYYTEIVGADMAVSTVIGEWEWADKDETKVNWSNEGSFGMSGGSGTFTVSKLTLDTFIYTATIFGGEDTAELGVDLDMEYSQELKAVNKL
jgi:hypothetical protein